MCFSEENSSVQDNDLIGGVRDKVVKFTCGNTFLFHYGNNLKPIFTMMSNEWDAMENKPSLLLYAGGAIFVVWLSSSVVRAVGSVPLVYIKLCYFPYTCVYVFSKPMLLIILSFVIRIIVSIYFAFCDV
jgi:hypothetical protein